MSEWARRQMAIRRPRTAITEVVVKEAAHEFGASVQRLDPRITEEPIPKRNGD